MVRFARFLWSGWCAFWLARVGRSWTAGPFSLAVEADTPALPAHWAAIAARDDHLAGCPRCQGGSWCATYTGLCRVANSELQAAYRACS